MYCKLSSFLILGMKKSGFCSAKLLLNMGAEVFVYDGNPSNATKDNIEKVVSYGGINVTDVYSILNEIDVLVLSPGVPIDNEIAIKARELNKRIIGELELASYFITNPLVAITGTNGKTTTSSMVSHLLTSAGVENLLLGNIGTPLSSAIDDFKKDTIGVVEVSSFQLETVQKFTPHIACVLNITPDHLDRHYNMDNYVYLKSKVLLNLRESEYAVLNYDDDNVSKMATRTRANIVWFSKSEKVDGCYLEKDKIFFDGEEVCEISDINLSGIHNIENTLATICILKILGLNLQEIKEGIKTFKGVKHRIQEVKTIDGITFYNDSKSTNPDSCLKAVESMTSPTVLIMGGYDKGFDYTNLFKGIKRCENVKKIVLTGSCSNKMFKCAMDEEISEVSVIKEFDLAISVAKNLAESGYNVLFSPATSSFDLFNGFEERGDKFIEIVNAFK